ncbi:rod shape-determining protein MreD [Salisaeta longa]|uniref:rod shape-determining protein MreD n=1 Tax=Salisaeta longa TaxID=503170 RepID=UPI0003B63CD2|nr:rod shape-determining protein MreD [Salisaeta longa]
MALSPRRLLAAVAVMLAQWLVLGRLAIWNSVPDAPLLFLAWYALRTNRRAGAVMGFALGLAMDVIYGTWGIYALVKTLIGFLLGAVALDDREALRIQVQQAFLGGLVIALFHNGLVVILLALQTESSNAVLVNSVWLGSAVYTGLLAVIAALFADGT